MQAEEATREVRFKDGQRVRALGTITEGGGGHPGREDAEFPDQNYIHAVKGNKGLIEHVTEDNYPTVRWSPKGTATIVSPEEIELLS